METIAPKQTIMFVIALEREAAPLRKFLTLQKDPLMDPNPIADSWVGAYEEMKIVLMLAKFDRKFNCDSIGPEIAATLTYIGVETYNPDLIISAGTAGAFET